MTTYKLKPAKHQSCHPETCNCAAYRIVYGKDNLFLPVNDRSTGQKVVDALNFVAHVKEASVDGMILKVPDTVFVASLEINNSAKDSHRLVLTQDNYPAPYQRESPPEKSVTLNHDQIPGLMRLLQEAYDNPDKYFNPA